MVVEDRLIPVLEEMLYELMENRLEVELIPSQIPEVADDGGKIRTAVSMNTDWYRDLCQQHPSNRYKKRNKRKDGTLVNRGYIILIIQRMIKNKKTQSTKYGPYILDVARDRVQYYEAWVKEQDGKYNVPFDNQF